MLRRAKTRVLVQSSISRVSCINQYEVERECRADGLVAISYSIPIIIDFIAVFIITEFHSQELSTYGQFFFFTTSGKTCPLSLLAILFTHVFFFRVYAAQM